MAIAMEGMMASKRVMMRRITAYYDTISFFDPLEQK
jgi:hypothetical protein